MSDEEIRLLVELTANKAAKSAVTEAKIEWGKDIELHAAHCQISKYRALKSIANASIGGIIVGVILSIIKFYMNKA